MRIPDNLLQTVCFLMVETPASGVHFGGTAFFVSVPSEQHPTKLHMHLVTAKHVVEKAKTIGQLGLRANTKDGGSAFVKLTGEWYYSEDEGSDAAVLPFGLPTDHFDYANFGIDMFATDQEIQDEGIGPGDNLVTIGLFSQRYGRTRNRPILRTGTLAAMPDEPLIDDAGKPYYVYLAEVRSIGGLSGSPVLAVLTPGRVVRIGDPVYLMTRVHVLGLIRGHWDVAPRDVPSVDFAGSDLDQVNMGIALVTPIQDVAAILMSEELVKHRRQVDREIAEEARAKP